MPGRRFLAANFAVLLVALAPRVGATSPRPRACEPDGSPSSDRRDDAAGDPIDELRRSDIALEAALRHPVPEWSPEAPIVRRRVRDVLGGMLDYDQLARCALGRDWDGLTDSQREQFVQLFSALVNQSFVSLMTRHDFHPSYGAETVAGPIATVTATALPDTAPRDRPQQIEYRLAIKRGRWLITDVLVDGVSVVDEYHDQFARLLRRGGFPTLVDRMQRKLDRGRAL